MVGLSLTRVAMLGVAFALVAGNSAFADGDVPSLKGKTIGITSIGNEHYWNIKAYQGAVDEIKRLGGEVIGLDAGYVDAKQIAQIQTLIAQKPDAIIEELGTAAALQPSFKKIVDAGIPLFTLDTGTSYAVNTVTSDNWKIGEELALKLVSDIGYEGNIVVFNGFYSVTPVAIRYDQLQSVLKYNPNVKIIQPELKEVIPNTVQDAQTQITEILNKYPKGEIKAIWSAWDVPQVGATQALVAAGRTEIKTYGVDGSPDIVSLIKEPAQPAAAVAAQQPYLIGKAAADNVARYLAGDKNIPKITYVPHLLVTKENAAEAQAQLGQDK
ncbi:sugar ABC transporter substrate-binding protein [Oryzibacter oryziterrae]|uniref:sugar ABC transporter substrate-binding protein n=1 Tax=Oryzibacter oryziterrae TaxID=2766474 RepID=UPI001F426137|nr:sugar ABC transporter substrate-binding protein [Oryzibacter oryziterrae]